MPRIQQVLENLGFAPNEIKVYLALNDHGSCKAGKVAKIAKIDRSSCYNSLKSLIEKGLVSYVLIGQVKWFQATGPKALKDFLKSQQEDLDEVLPELHARHKASKIKVDTLEGEKNLQVVFNRNITVKGALVGTCKEIYENEVLVGCERRLPARCNTANECRCKVPDIHSVVQLGIINQTEEGLANKTYSCYLNKP